MGEVIDFEQYIKIEVVLEDDWELMVEEALQEVYEDLVKEAEVWEKEPANEGGNSDDLVLFLDDDELDRILEAEYNDMGDDDDYIWDWD
jgi:hypothetical protein